MRKLKHKHKLKHCLLRLVAVPTSVLIWPAEDTFQLLNRFTLSATANVLHIVTTTQNAHEIAICFCRKIDLDPMGRGLPTSCHIMGSLSAFRPRSDHLSSYACGGGRDLSRWPADRKRSTLTTQAPSNTEMRRSV